MLVNIGNVTSEVALESFFTPAMILLIVLVVLLAFDGIYHIMSRPKRKQKEKALRNHIQKLMDNDIRIYGKVEDPENYSLVQMEVTVMVPNDKVELAIPSLQSNTTLVQHEIVEVYNAKDFIIQGGDQV